MIINEHISRNIFSYSSLQIFRLVIFRFDAGDIVKQMRTQIGPHEFAPELHNRLADESANLVMDVIKNLPKIVQKPKPQETKNVTFGKYNPYDHYYRKYYSCIV